MDSDTVNKLEHIVNNLEKFITQYEDTHPITREVKKKKTTVLSSLDKDENQDKNMDKLLASYEDKYNILLKKIEELKYDSIHTNYDVSVLKQKELIDKQWIHTIIKHLMNQLESYNYESIPHFGLY